MKLKDLMSIDELDQHIAYGSVSKQQASKEIGSDLTIYNYTHVAQHENLWDNVTEHCRGLIVGAGDYGTGEIIARPFRKFFNLNTSFRPETMEETLPNVKPYVSEKVDGSLGILFKHENKGFGPNVHIATRGSFASEQAQWATAWYRKHTMGLYGDWPAGYTPLFEIIYNENRIVVSYPFEGLVLLGLVHIDTGMELPPEEVRSWGRKNNLRVATQYPNLDLAQAKQDQSTNIEGYVLSYWDSKNLSAPLRVKVKTEEYCRLHKIVTGLNPKGIWEHLMAGGNPDDLWYTVGANQQFSTWCIGWINLLKGLFTKLESKATEAFGRVSIKALREIQQKGIVDDRATRKCYAMAIQQEPGSLQSILFAMYKAENYAPVIWKQLEPKMDGKEARIPNADTFNGL